jgi:hypothetical protein
MPYQLMDFAGIDLPVAMSEDDLSTGQVASTLAASIGGVYDVAGSARRWPGAHQFSHKGIYEAGGSFTIDRITTNGDTRVTSTGDTRVIIANPIYELMQKTDSLKAMIGTRGALYRRRYFDQARSWKTCRLLEVRHTETVEQASVVAEVESVYETSMNGWHAATATTVSADISSGVATPLNVFNSGILPVYDGVLTVTRLGSTITQVTVTSPLTNLVWTGTIAAAQSLVIDAGRQTITNGGADAYSGLVVGASVTEWLPLNVGTNVITVTATGGNAHVDFVFYAQWP